MPRRFAYCGSLLLACLLSGLRVLALTRARVRARRYARVIHGDLISVLVAGAGCSGWRGSLPLINQLSRHWLQITIALKVMQTAH
jgi:hypothetical protein